jgi:uncharacterized repeat protein (TIGR02543 family)
VAYVLPGTTVALPTPTTAPEGYTFVGWTTEKTVSKTQPDLFTANETVNGNMKLYALYKHVEGGGNVKITSADDLKVGMTVAITDKDNTNAISTTQNNNNRAATAFDSTAISADVQLLTLEAGTQSGTYALSTGSGYLYTGSTTANRLHTSTEKNDKCDWTITFTNGAVSIKSVNNTSRGLMLYNFDSKLFACYEKTSEQTTTLALWKIEIPDITYTTLNFDSASLTLSEGLVMNYKVAMDDEIAKEAVMNFEFAGETYENVEGRKEGNLWVYSLQVAPQYMGQNIKAELKLGDLVLASKAEYSVKEYVEYQLTVSDSEEMANLLNSILLYGAAAQEHQDYDVEHIVADTTALDELFVPELPEEQQFSLVNADVENGYPVWFANASLNFSSLNTLYVKLSSLDENVKLVVNGEEVELTNKTFSTGALMPTDFNTVYTFKLYYDGELMQTLTYSVNIYAYEFGQEGKSGTMANLARALYNYGAAVEAYVAANAEQA